MEKNHELAYEQFIIQKAIPEPMELYSNEEISISLDTVSYLIESKLFKLVIDNKTGEINKWVHQDGLITNDAIRPNFWRPPTDNDLGNGMHNWAAIWQVASSKFKPFLKKEPYRSRNGISFEVEYLFPEEIAKLLVEYSINIKGELTVKYNFSALKQNLPNIPRLGMYMTVDDNFTEVEWYGRGPHESYWDRKTSARAGIYNGEVSKEFHRYPRPQETGNKSDVRWMSISSDNTKLIVESFDENYLNCSLWPFSMEELDFVAAKDGGISASGLVPVTARHGADITIGKTVQWNIDHLQMGVGGDTSWGRLVHDEYTIPPGDYSYGFIIKPSRQISLKGYY